MGCKKILGYVICNILMNKLLAFVTKFLASRGRGSHFEVCPPPAPLVFIYDGIFRNVLKNKGTYLFVFSLFCALAKIKMIYRRIGTHFNWEIGSNVLFHKLNGGCMHGASNGFQVLCLFTESLNDLVIIDIARYWFFVRVVEVRAPLNVQVQCSKVHFDNRKNIQSPWKIETCYTKIYRLHYLETYYV